MRSVEAASDMTDFKDLDTTMKTTDSGQVSGGSSIGSHSPPNMEGGSSLLPPPRHLLPPTLRPSPGVKMHPLTSVVPAQFKGKPHVLYWQWSECGLELEFAFSLWQAHVQVQIRLLKVPFN